jgi:hypothetical protein
MQHKEKVERRRQELNEEKLDQTMVSYYEQWNKDDPSYEDFREVKYASGRIITTPLHQKQEISTVRFDANLKWEWIKKLTGNRLIK